MLTNKGMLSLGIGIALAVGTLGLTSCEPHVEGNVYGPPPITLGAVASLSGESGSEDQPSRATIDQAINLLVELRSYADAEEAGKGIEWLRAVNVAASSLDDVPDDVLIDQLATLAHRLLDEARWYRFVDTMEIYIRQHCDFGVREEWTAVRSYRKALDMSIGMTQSRLSIALGPNGDRGAMQRALIYAQHELPAIRSQRIKLVNYLHKELLDGGKTMEEQNRDFIDMIAERLQ